MVDVRVQFPGGEHGGQTMKEQLSLLKLDTAEEAECPVCKAINRPMIPIEKYTCGNCGHEWQPATQATRQPLFTTQEKES